MRGAAWALLLLLLAGCLHAPAQPSPSTSASASSTTGVSVPTPMPTPSGPPVVDLLTGFSLGPCRGISVQATEPQSRVQALLPSGFTAAQQPSGGVGSAIVGLDLYACGNLTTSGVSIPDTVYGQVYALVDRPEQRVPGAPEAAVQEYVFRVLAGKDVLAALWPAAGYDTRNGTASVSVDPPVGGAPDVGVRSGDGMVGSDYYVMAQGGPPALPQPSPRTFVRYTALADGSVLVWTGTYDFPGGTSGPGVFQVAADDALAGFAAGKYVPGQARLWGTGTMQGMDLRRIFTTAG
jgi:hypothetical protein